MIQKPMMVTPARKVFERASWRRVSRRATWAAVGCMAAGFAMLMPAACRCASDEKRGYTDARSARRPSFGGGVPDARVEERVKNVCEQRRGQKDQTNDKDAALQHREVLVL